MGKFDEIAKMKSALSDAGVDYDPIGLSHDDCVRLCNENGVDVEGVDDVGGGSGGGLGSTESGDYSIGGKLDFNAP